LIIDGPPIISSEVTPQQIIFGWSNQENEKGGTCNMYGKKGGTYRVLVGRLEGKSLFGKHRGRWKDYIKMALE
jgi:hypothetical protein